MKLMAFSLQTLLLMILFALSANAALASEYNYRDLMGNTMPPARCSDKAKAEADAVDPYLLKKKQKVFCETQGYGWHVHEEKSAGKLVCQECTSEQDKGKFHCHLEDVVVACKRLKPGSVGMFPGKG